LAQGSNPPTQSMAGEWVLVCRLSELDEDEGARIHLPAVKEKVDIAVWKHENKVYALENRCCHKSASLHRGDIEDLGTCIVDKRGQKGSGGVCVRCPKHHRKFGGGLYFNLETGEARQPEFTAHFRDLKQHHVRAYDVRVSNGNVYVWMLNKSSSGRAVHHPTMDVVPVASDSSVRNLGKRQREEDHAAFPLKLLDVKHVNHDTCIFILAQSDESRLPLPPTSSVWHVSILASIDGQLVEREYTPLSSWQEWSGNRILRLLIKVYPDGIMTQHLAKLKVGASIQVSAPTETLSMRSAPMAKTASPPDHLILIAGGTGIMPMLQILQEALHDSSPTRSCVLVYSNKSPEDLLCWPQICELEATRSKVKAFKVIAAFTSLASQDAIFEKFGAPLAEVVRKRVDSAALAEVLRPLSRSLQEKHDHVQVIVSGPVGLFQTMFDAFPTPFQQECMWVNLDE